jgi:tryptophan synthase alpha chain
MNRINKLFQKKNKKILSIYFTAGYPRINDSVNIIKALDKNGVDMIEVGIPFSDPIADGPIIQNSSTIAIKNGMNMSLLFNQLKNIRSTTQIPIILMGYINPIIQFGYDKFVDKLIDCGIDGVILPDLPLLEYKKELKPFFDKNNISFISLISPNTSIERVKEIDKISDGFLYVVSSSSITGQNNLFDVNQIKYFNSLNNIFLKNPKIIGFGISDKKSFDMACNYSNGAIIGTKFINSLDVLNLNKSIEKFINSILL